MEHLDLTLKVFLYGIVFLTIGILFEKILIRGGWIRGKTIMVAVQCFLIGSIMSILDRENAFLFFGILANLLAVISLNRRDLFTSTQKGQWWWKSEIDATVDE